MKPSIKFMSLALLSVLGISSSAFAAQTVTVPRLQTGLYMCGECRLALQQNGDTITVTPGSNCGPYRATAEYVRNEKGGRYFVSYRRDQNYNVFPVYMKPTSSISYLFTSGNSGGKLLCVKI